MKLLIVALLLVLVAACFAGSPLLLNLTAATIQTPAIPPPNIKDGKLWQEQNLYWQAYCKRDVDCLLRHGAMI